MKTKLYTLIAVITCSLLTSVQGADKAQIEAHYNSYFKAGKEVVDMVLSNSVDVAEVRKRANAMEADAIWLSKEYAKIHTEGTKLLKAIWEHEDHLKTISFDELESEWHDWGYFAKPGNDPGIDLEDEDNEHFSDPIHAIVHPLMVAKAAESWDATKDKRHLQVMKEEMEEGLEQVELTKDELLR